MFRAGDAFYFSEFLAYDGCDQAGFSKCADDGFVTKDVELLLRIAGSIPVAHQAEFADQGRAADLARQNLATEGDLVQQHGDLTGILRVPLLLLQNVPSECDPR